MKVRKLAVALALAGGLGSGVAQALGLGEIELQSYLNEPLDAEIGLRQSSGVNPADVFVNIASEQAYERVGLDRNQFLSKLRFQVVTGNDGSLIVNVSSREPLREPYLNFLLELTWPNGRLMREYAVLVDPPVYAEESGVQEQVSTPTVSMSQAISQPTTTRSAESVRRQAQAERSQGSGYQADTFGPTGASDTLWTIASQVRPDNSVSMQQVMLAIQDLNPNAFIGNNINRLKRGEVLRVPSLDQIQSRTRAEATRVVAQQNQEFQTPQRTVDATAEQQAASAPQQQAGAGGDELKLVVSEDAGSDASESGSAGGDSELPGGVDAGTAVAMEELESARRENDELNSRVEDLQDQVQTLQRLLELKNTQLAEMQQTAGDETAEQTAPVESPAADDGAEASAAIDEAVEGDTAPVDSDMMAGEAEDPEAAGESGDMAESEAMVDETDEMAGSDQATDDQMGADAGDASEQAEMSGADEPALAATDDAVEETAAAEPAPTQTEQSAEPAPKPAQQAPAADKGFPGNVIDAITGNPMYQIALGGGLIVLLLLLLLLARRNANREKAFYEQLNNETEEETDSFDLSLDEEDQQSAAGDALAEADSYIAYGQHDRAAQALETAISREPSRTDLRLKLLGVYADIQDRDSFEKQFGEVEALDDEEALTTANELRARLEEAESMPSIDDLESQLRSDSFATSYDSEETGDESTEKQDKPESDELLADQFDSEKEEPAENEFGDFDSDLSETDFSDFELDDLDESEASKSSKQSVSEEDKEESRDDMIEYDLSGLELESDEEKPAIEDTSELEESTDWDLSSEFEADSDKPSGTEQGLDDSDDDLSLDLEEGDLDEGGLADELPAGKPETTSEEGSEQGTDTDGESDIDSLDESFLDELDAELDKVAGEEDELGGSEMEESSLDDLELDVSDEDLALMEEFSDSADSANPEESEEASLDEELGLEDTLGEGDAEEADPEQTVEDAEDLEQLGVTDELEDSETPESDLDLPVASDEVSDESRKSQAADIEESELGDEDDFDFLAGTDEAATKLDLARAYIEMGDADGARDILEEVSLEGNEDQKAEAQDLLKNLS
ncbi:pilus assembly protein FimV [Marinobacter sp. es.042]|uniref:FimV/HubP family polar landmark protein n=1 Tax=Marinobacter sp. es.042 TaxID=1761794 RepID=UPI000B50E0D5|nr:FimV/HubP family polar landmark protein [Marinobacter sp. es.042]SNB55600.1 pilus assembly protein FimV [Marinobacter sp. es.042]